MALSRESTEQVQEVIEPANGELNGRTSRVSPKFMVSDLGSIHQDAGVYTLCYVEVSIRMRWNCLQKPT